MEEIEWQKLRADQLREMAERNAIVIVPIGALEQHGPHLPAGVDSILGETIALRTARLVAEREPVVVLPCIWSGISENHMSLGGTITLDFEAFFGLMRCVVSSLARQGFRRIVLLNSHGGNNDALRICCDELSTRFNLPLVRMTYWHAAPDAIARNLETQAGLFHACEAETSMMMALRPELVAEDRIPSSDGRTSPGIRDVVGAGVYLWQSSKNRSPTGVIGNPAAATKEKGQRLLEEIPQELAAKIAAREL